MTFADPKNLHVLRVREAATPRERVLVRVLRPCDLGKYAIVPCRVDDEGFLPLNRLVFWFPDATMAEGDLVVLHSKQGVQVSKGNADGRQTHHFYWGLKAPIWSEGRGPALIYIAAVQVSQDLA